LYIGGDNLKPIRTWNNFGKDITAAEELPTKYGVPYSVLTEEGPLTPNPKS
jgi:hypothetical protein